MSIVQCITLFIVLISTVAKVNLPIHENKNRVPYVKVHVNL